MKGTCHLLKTCSVPVLVLFSATAADAQASSEREQLLELLAEQTELATKTRLNADFVPGIINILQGDVLARRGARTVWDALAFVPGINPVIDQLGHRRLVVRGLGAVGDNWSSGNVKVLLNGITVNTDDKGLADPVYFLPIAQVERIEVIRGPGSALHGEYAMAGVVNVITHSEERLFALTGSRNEVGGGAVLEAGSEDTLRFSLNVGTWKSDGANVRTGRDALYQAGEGAASYAPGDANDALASTHAMARLATGAFRLLGQWSELQLGDHFGINYNLPPESDHLVEHSRIRQLEGRYTWDLPSGSLDLFAGSRNYLLRKDDLFADVSESYGIPDGPDVLVDLDYEEVRRYAGLDLNWTAGAHDLLVGAYGARVDIHQSHQAVSTQPVAGEYAVPEDAERRISSAIVQDEYRYSDRFSITTGARYDHYSDVGSRITPRLAGV